MSPINHTKGGTPLSGVAAPQSVRAGGLKFAYADPPYLGMARLYADRHPEALVWDDPETHRALVRRLCEEFPDGWALSLHSPSLQAILPMCPADVRIGAWVKPFASFKPGVNPAYAWEPVIFRGGRKRGRDALTIRDWVAEPITLRRGFPGAKPEAFAFWLFGLLGMEPGDEFHDLLPGSGAITRAWDAWRVQPTLPLVADAPIAAARDEVLPLFAGGAL